MASSVDTGEAVTILFHALEHLKKQTPRKLLINTEDMELVCDLIIQVGTLPPGLTKPTDRQAQNDRPPA